MKDLESIGGYVYSGSDCGHEHAYLLPQLERLLADFFQNRGDSEHRIFDLGCGNGAVAHHLSTLGYTVTGVDPSFAGIQHAQSAYANLRLERGSAYDDLAATYGTFPVVISLEVVEHVYAPRDFAKNLFKLVDEDGIAILSTPYHSYLKNLVLAVSGKMDKHFSPLWDHGHIKFWSIRSLSQLLTEVGFREPRFHRVGRFAPIAKSMIAVASKH